MSAPALQAALVTALKSRAGLGDVVSGIFDGPPPRTPFPYVGIGAWVTTDWGYKGGRGREHRMAISIWDDGRTPARVHGLMHHAERAIEAIETVPGATLVTLDFIRGRVVRDPAGPWAGIIEYRVRLIDA